MHTVKLVAAFCENRPGLLARLTRVLAEADIKIRWMTIATSSTFGVAKVLVNHPDRALERLRQAGFTASPVEVLAVEVADRPPAVCTPWRMYWRGTALTSKTPRAL